MVIRNGSTAWLPPLGRRWRKARRHLSAQLQIVEATYLLVYLAEDKTTSTGAAFIHNKESPQLNGRFWPKAEVSGNSSASLSCIRHYCFVSDFIAVHDFRNP